MYTILLYIVKKTAMLLAKIWGLILKKSKTVLCIIQELAYICLVEDLRGPCRSLSGFHEGIVPEPGGKVQGVTHSMGWQQWRIITIADIQGQVELIDSCRGGQSLWSRGFPASTYPTLSLPGPPFSCPESCWPGGLRS